MAELVINDVPVQADPGEGLLTVARRNQAHIGFACDGNGLCTTCECKILSGAENLSEVNEIERDWITNARLEKGYRLACQTALMGNGKVVVLTRAEELQRLAANVLNPPAGTTTGDNLSKFLSFFVEVNLSHISNFPFSVFHAVGRIGVVKTLFPFTSDYLKDVNGIVNSRLGRPVEVIEEPIPKAEPTRSR